MWRRGTDCWPCCLSLSNPLTSPRSAWPDGSWWRDNRMAAWHLPRDLMRHSSGLKELAQTTKTVEICIEKLYTKLEEINWNGFLKRCSEKSVQTIRQLRTHFKHANDLTPVLLPCIGTYDFFGLNHYTSYIAEPATEQNKQLKFHPDMDVIAFPDPSWERAGTANGHVNDGVIGLTQDALLLEFKVLWNSLCANFAKRVWLSENIYKFGGIFPGNPSRTVVFLD